MQNRVRDVKVPMKHKGEPCAETSESKQCNVAACSKDCELKQWTMWTRCSKDCDGGSSKRVRLINKPAEGSGKCAGQWDKERLEYQTCNVHSCDVVKGWVLGCFEKRDLVLVIDRTPSGGEESFKAMQKQAIKFAAAQGDAIFSVISYTGPRTWKGVSKCTGESTGSVNTEKDCHVKTDQGFSANETETEKVINGLTYQPGSKLLSMALLAAKSALSLGRADVQTVVIVYMDGQPLSSRKTRLAARSLRKKARLHFVVINKFAPLKNIKKWVTRRWEENLVIAENAAVMESADTGTHVVANICPSSEPELEMALAPEGEMLE